MKRIKKTQKSIIKGVIAIIFLIICLCITTLALVYPNIVIDNNAFTTGKMEINLNDGNPVIQETKQPFIPGATISKTFFIVNKGTMDAYYRVYFDNISGNLANTITVIVKNNDTVICSGIMAELNRKSAQAADDILKIGERKTLSITFNYPKEASEGGDGSLLTFSLCAEATQTKNNNDKLFN